MDEGMRIDLNAATAEMLCRLPGIGTDLAEAIVAEREAGGAFADLDDLRRVQGMDAERIDGLRGLLAEDGTLMAPAGQEEADPADLPAMLEDVSVVEAEAAQPEPVASIAADQVAPADGLRPATDPEPAASAYTLQPPLQVIERKGGIGFFPALVLVLAGAFLGALLALGVFLALNGTLQIGRHRQVQAMQMQVLQAQADNETLQQTVEILNDQLKETRTQTSKIPQLEADLEQANTALKELSGSVGAMQTKLSEVDAVLQETARTLKLVRAQADRFDAFLSGLAELLQATAPAVK